MRVRFKRYLRIEECVRGVTPRRIAAAKRALRAEQERLPLFASLIAESQPSPEERIERIDTGLIRGMVETRKRIARSWRDTRSKLRAMPADERAFLLSYWNRSAMPGTHDYLADLVHRWTERGWRPECRNEEEEQRRWAEGRVRLNALFERWRKEGKLVGGVA